jgi:hypothetical protein
MGRYNRSCTKKQTGAQFITPGLYFRQWVFLLNNKEALRSIIVDAPLEEERNAATSFAPELSCLFLPTKILFEGLLIYTIGL